MFRLTQSDRVQPTWQRPSPLLPNHLAEWPLPFFLATPDIPDPSGIGTGGHHPGSDSGVHPFGQNEPGRIMRPCAGGGLFQPTGQLCSGTQL